MNNTNLVFYKDRDHHINVSRGVGDHVTSTDTSSRLHSDQFPVIELQVIGEGFNVTAMTVTSHHKEERDTENNKRRIDRSEIPSKQLSTTSRQDTYRGCRCCSCSRRPLPLIRRKLSAIIVCWHARTRGGGRSLWPASVMYRLVINSGIDPSCLTSYHTDPEVTKQLTAATTKTRTRT